MAEFRQIHCHIWQDTWFIDLCPEEKLLYIYLFSNTNASASGIYEIPLKVIAFETCLSQERVSEIINGFQNIGKVFYENGVVWIPKMRYYQGSPSPKLQKRIEQDINKVPDGRIKKLYIDHISKNKYPIDTLSIPYLENDSDTDTDTDTDIDTDTDTEKNTDTDTDTEIVQIQNFSRNNKNSTTSYNVYFNPKLLPLWTSITGMFDIPGKEKEKVLPAFELIYSHYKTDDEFIMDGKKYFNEWCSRISRDGIKYRKTNCSWFYNWWVAGEIPEISTETKQKLEKQNNKRTDREIVDDWNKWCDENGQTEKKIEYKIPK